MELTDDFIQSLAYPEYYERGEEYYRHGRVIGLLEKDGLVTATVHGSHDYLVTVDKNDLEMHCNCPAYSRKSVCKHVIAVLLTIISGETKPNRQNTLKGARKNIARTKPRVSPPGDGMTILIFRTKFFVRDKR